MIGAPGWFARQSFAGRTYPTHPPRQSGTQPQEGTSMRRKLNRSQSSTPEPVATPEPATVETPEPVAAVVTAEPATHLPSRLAAAFGAPLPEPEAAPQDSGGASFPPRIGFVSGRERSAQAQLLAGALGNVPPGTPYLQHGKDRAWPLTGLVVAQQREVYFSAVKVWDDEAGAYTYKDVSTKPRKDAQGRDLVHEASGKRYSDHYLTLQLVLPAKSQLPDALAPGVAAVTIFDGPRYHAAAGMVRKLNEAKGSAWAKANGPLASLPPRLRVVGELWGSKPSGKNYVKGRVTCATPSMSTLEAVAEWDADPQAQAQLADAVAYFEDEARRLGLTA